MGRLASQTAAHKLLHILGLLVIPILVLLTFYFQKSKNEIDVFARERSGVVLAQWVLSAPQALEAKHLEQLKQLEQAAGLVEGQSILIGGRQNKSDHLRDYFMRVAKVSRVVMDPDQVVQAQADAALQLLPSYSEKLNALVSHPALGQTGQVAGLPQFGSFLVAVGDTHAVLRRIDDALHAGDELRGQDIATALTDFNQTDVIVNKVAQLLNDGGANALAQQQGLTDLRSKVAALSKVGVPTLQNKLLNNVERKLSARIRGLWRNLGILMFAGISSAIAGVGLAILMMRSTLLRLDEVETARKEANAARSEAESIALRFTTINADISRLNQDMASNVNDLKAAQEELVKKGRMEQLGQLIATIAHEVRNPLGAIRTTAFMLERKIADKGLGLEGHLQRINNSVNRCDTIIAQLLDYSRTREVNSTPLLLDDWLAKVVREEAARLPENILIECALGLDAMTVPIDPVRMQRALVNLLSNASEALLGQHDRSNGASQLHHHIWVSTKRLGDFAVIRVADNGPGIAAEFIQKVREPLFTTKSFGTGLGIPAVEQVVNQHGGHLDISSDLGKGAVFTIHLPFERRRNLAA